MDFRIANSSFLITQYFLSGLVVVPEVLHFFFIIIAGWTQQSRSLSDLGFFIVVPTCAMFTPFTGTIF